MPLPSIIERIRSRTSSRPSQRSTSTSSSTGGTPPSSTLLSPITPLTATSSTSPGPPYSETPPKPTVLLNQPILPRAAISAMLDAPPSSPRSSTAALSRTGSGTGTGAGGVLINTTPSWTTAPNETAHPSTALKPATRRRHSFSSGTTPSSRPSLSSTTSLNLPSTLQTLESPTNQPAGHASSSRPHGGPSQSQSHRPRLARLAEDWSTFGRSNSRPPVIPESVPHSREQSRTRPSSLVATPAARSSPLSSRPSTGTGAGPNTATGHVQVQVPGSPSRGQAAQGGPPSAWTNVPSRSSTDPSSPSHTNSNSRHGSGSGDKTSPQHGNSAGSAGRSSKAPSRSDSRGSKGSRGSGSASKGSRSLSRRSSAVKENNARVPPTPSRGGGHAGLRPSPVISGGRTAGGGGGGGWTGMAGGGLYALGAALNPSRIFGGSRAATPSQKGSAGGTRSASPHPVENEDSTAWLSPPAFVWDSPSSVGGGITQNPLSIPNSPMATSASHTNSVRSSPRILTDSASQNHTPLDSPTPMAMLDTPRWSPAVLNTGPDHGKGLGFSFTFPRTRTSSTPRHSLSLPTFNVTDMNIVHPNSEDPKPATLPRMEALLGSSDLALSESGATPNAVVSLPRGDRVPDAPSFFAVVPSAHAHDERVGVGRVLHSSLSSPPSLVLVDTPTPVPVIPIDSEGEVVVIGYEMGHDGDGVTDVDPHLIAPTFIPTPSSANSGFAQSPSRRDDDDLLDRSSLSHIMPASSTLQPPSSPGSPSPAPRSHSRRTGQSLTQALHDASHDQDASTSSQTPLLMTSRPSAPLTSSALGSSSMTGPSPSASILPATSPTRQMRPRVKHQHTFPRAQPITPQGSSSSSSAPNSHGPATPTPKPRSAMKKRPSNYSTPRRTMSADDGLGHERERVESRSSIGKRKEREDGGEGESAVEITPPDQRGSVRATRFAAQDSRGQRVSDASHGSYYRKRPRTSEPMPFVPMSPRTPPPGTPRTPGTPSTSRGHNTSQSVDLNDLSWSTDASSPRPLRPSPPRSNTNSPQTRPLLSTPASPTSPSYGQGGRKGGARRTSILSVASGIPVSALVSPHAPSLDRSTRQAGYYMRDPARVTTVKTPWTPEMPGSIAGWWWAWAFYIGFILFPVWWVVSWAKVPETRRFSVDEREEKGMVVDDPQIERDARTWRTRCRIMAGVSLLTYVPFVVLVAWFATRHTT